MKETKTTIKRTVVIAKDASLSSVLDKSHYTRVLILMSAAWTAAEIHIHVSDTKDGTFVPLEYGSDGNEVAITAEAAVAIGLDGKIGEAIAAAPFIKISSEDGQGGATTQTAERKIDFILSRW